LSAWEEEGRLNGEVMKDELTSGLLLNHDFRRTQLRDAQLLDQSFSQRSVPTQSVRSPADFGRSGGVSPRGASSAGDVPTVGDDGGRRAQRRFLDRKVQNRCPG
jgi:hypothetical protein